MRKWVFILTLIGIDFLAFFFSLFLAYKSRILLGNLFPNLFPAFNLCFSHFALSFWIPAILFFLLHYEGLYTQNFIHPEEIKRILKAIFFWLFLIFFVVGIFKKSGEISRTTIIFTGFYLIFFLPIARLGVKSLLFKKNIGTKKLLIVGVNEYTLEVAKIFYENPYLGYKIAGFFDNNPNPGFIEMKDQRFEIKFLKDLEKTLKTKIADGILLSLDLFPTEEKLLNYLCNIQKLCSEILLLPGKTAFALLNMENLPLYISKIAVFKSKNNMNSALNRFLKNFIELFITLIFLPLVSILTILIAIFIKIDSPGPIFFTQERVGKNGKKIKIYKFRTMVTDAENNLEKLIKENENFAKEWNQKRKLMYDPRITKVGKFLRRFSLDELPQFINILKGEMSLIGPRPVTQEELDRYYKEYKNIYLQVKPGLTGFWQVMGRNEIDYPTRVLMDIFYILNWSPWLDFYILIKTPIALITGRGAY